MNTYEAAVFVWGLLWGSFLNVCIYRIPDGQDIVLKPSHCPKCQKQIAWYDNLPLVSYVILRGKCRGCKAPISAQYPIVELAAALVTLAVYKNFGLTPAAAEMWVLSMALIVLIKIDLDHYLLPNVITYPGMAVGVIWSLTGFGVTRPLSSVLGFLFGFGFFYVVALVYEKWKKKEGLGGGDIKLLGMLGAFLGVESVLVIVIVSSLLGSVVGLGHMAIRKQGWGAALPFGPFLAIGAWVYMFWGHALLTWYLGRY